MVSVIADDLLIRRSLEKIVALLKGAEFSDELLLKSRGLSTLLK